MRRAAATIVGSLSLALSLPTAAGGQTPAPTPTPPPPPPPAPAPVPAAGAMSIKLERVSRVGRDDVVLRGDRLRVRGAVAPYVAGQTVVVRLYRGRTKLAAKAVAVRPVPGTPNGGFAVSLRPPSGRLTVRASHRATTAQVTMVARARRVLVVTPHAGPGARGPIVRLVQSRLAGLRYAVSRSGTFDASTARAVVAYRKVRGMSRIGVASRSVVRGLLARRGSFKARHPQHGKHVEVDLSRQVMALLRGGRVYRIYGVSSGKASTPTVLGRYRVYSKTIGTNALGMVDSSYFIGGYAIHGYVSVPTFPASHGCVRVPIPNAGSIYRWLRIGDRVDVYP
ncbi:MAG TPA: L,D-transpeptidase family protein [Solirubrobacteraceae bacterium]|nr:L,D-transpeptidase family protein [Solirubrobacteraceae bacterium]